MLGRSGAHGPERPGSKKYRFLIKILLKSNDFEHRGDPGQAARSGRDRKSIGFLIKILLKSNDFERRGDPGSPSPPKADPTDPKFLFHN